MKFKNPSSANFLDSATLLGGGVAGGMLSKGVFGVIHSPSGAVDPATVKKEENMALAKRLGLIVVAGYAASAISSKDTASEIAKGAAFGVAVAQTLEVVKSLAKKSPALTAQASAGTKTGKFLADTLGLACPCNQVGMGRARRRPRGLKMVAEAAFHPQYHAIEMAGADPLQNALESFAYSN